ncbi:hypothetical protein ACIQVO_20600 [Streptomyces sp. NPDC101062]
MFRDVSRDVFRHVFRFRGVLHDVLPGAFLVDCLLLGCARH